MTETFHAGDLLSVTTGRLVSPSHMDGVYRLVDYMTGVPHFTIQLSRGADACIPALLEQHSWLTRVVVPEEFNGREHVESWLAGVVDEHGEHHPVEPLPAGSYTGRDPLTELQERMGPGRVVPVVMGDE